jgi:large subunit ribosomal protein L24e
MPLNLSCSFCGKSIEPGTGLMFVRNDNQRFYFCSHKCESNMLKLRRRARRVKWTESYERGPSPPQPEEPPEAPTEEPEGEPEGEPEEEPEEEPEGELEEEKPPKKGPSGESESEEVAPDSEDKKEGG